MTLRPGGFDDPSQGWTGGYAKRGTTGSVYLDAEYTVLEGQYAKRKIWSLIGLFSPKGPDWANMGRAYVRSVLNSARGLSEKDNSPQAQNARRIAGLGHVVILSMSTGCMCSLLLWFSEAVTGSEMGLQPAWAVASNEPFK